MKEQYYKRSLLLRIKRGMGLRLRLQITGYGERGQVIIILLLLMLVGLSIGLALTQRSVTDVTTSTQAEQSSRAFSAAEAGLEKALTSTVPGNTVVSLDNNSMAEVNGSNLLPVPPSTAAVEYPPIGREITAQFWFANPSSPGPPAAYYNPAASTFDLYYGNASTTDLPAVEVIVVMQSGTSYYSYAAYYDSNSGRTALPNGNGFTPTSCTNPPGFTTILGDNRQFFCKQLVGPVPDLGTVSTTDSCGTATCRLVLARVRFLYINDNHSLALAPINGQLPPQVQIYNATGISGQSHKQIQAFRVKDVVAPWFDYAIFSTNEIRK